MSVFPKAILSTSGHRLRLQPVYLQATSLTQCTEYVLAILHSFPSLSWILHHTNPTYPSTIPSFAPDSLVCLFKTVCLPFLAILGTFEHEEVKDALIKGLKSVGVLVTMK